jgi:hypothetical protein
VMETREWVLDTLRCPRLAGHVQRPARFRGVRQRHLTVLGTLRRVSGTAVGTLRLVLDKACTSVGHSIVSGTRTSVLDTAWSVEGRSASVLEKRVWVLDTLRLALDARFNRRGRAATPAHGSTFFSMCNVRCWRWLLGNNKPISLSDTKEKVSPPSPETSCECVDCGLREMVCS